MNDPGIQIGNLSFPTTEKCEGSHTHGKSNTGYGSGAQATKVSHFNHEKHQWVQWAVPGLSYPCCKFPRNSSESLKKQKPLQTLSWTFIQSEICKNSMCTEVCTQTHTCTLSDHPSGVLKEVSFLSTPLMAPPFSWKLRTGPIHIHTHTFLFFSVAVLLYSWHCTSPTITFHILSAMEKRPLPLHLYLASALSWFTSVLPL